MEKKIYEEPTVQKVEFDFKTRIAASSCLAPSGYKGDGVDECMNW